MIGAARSRRPLLRRTVDEGLRSGVGRSCSSSRSGRASIRLSPSRVPSAPGTSTRRSSPSDARGCRRTSVVSSVSSKPRSRTDANGSRTRSSSRASPIASARGGGGRADRLETRDRSRRGAHAAGVPALHRGTAVRRRRRRGQDQPRARRWPATGLDGRARARDRLPARCALRPDRRRAICASCASGVRRRHARAAGARSS